MGTYSDQYMGSALSLVTTLYQNSGYLVADPEVLIGGFTVTYLRGFLKKDRNRSLYRLLQIHLTKSRADKHHCRCHGVIFYIDGQIYTCRNLQPTGLLK